MRLSTQLVQTKVKQRYNLSTDLFGGLETLRVKLDSCDHLFVWLDHSLLSEKLLQVIRKIRSTSVTRVHGNENTHGIIELNISTH